MNNTINFFLVNIELSEIHLLSFASFNKLGYKCILWCYEDFDSTEVPKYVQIKDANLICPKIQMDNIRFADYFRYKIIYEFGGIYSDTDNIAISRLPEEEYIFSGDNRTLNNHLFKCPKECKFLKQLIDDIESSDKSLLFMQEVSSGLLKRVHDENLQDFIVDYSKTYYLKRDLEGLHSKVLDLNSLQGIYTIHLFESSIRGDYKLTENFKENMKNLKKLVL